MKCKEKVPGKLRGKLVLEKVPDEMCGKLMLEQVPREMRKKLMPFVYVYWQNVAIYAL